MRTDLPLNRDAHMTGPYRQTLCGDPVANFRRAEAVRARFWEAMEANTAEFLAATRKAGAVVASQAGEDPKEENDDVL